MSLRARLGGGSRRRRKKAEALYLADRAFEALEAINEAEAIAERFEHRYFSAELHRRLEPKLFSDGK